ncbi:MAG TPA: translation initiation factor IF-2 [Sedimentisphaerales bacterium]|nr:translation initiation factor IF-2 [Sedimentisphaerales bacterium]
MYILARELGVKSSSIVKKCQDEGLDVRNHMATISAGLAATIREWFSEGENVTTVETAEKVDLAEVRVRRKPRAEGVGVDSDGEEAEGEAAEPDEFSVEPPVEEELEPAPMEESAQPVEATLPVEVMEAPPEPAAPSVEVVAATPDVAAQVPEPTLVQVQEKPAELPRPMVRAREPIVVLPAGPMLDKPRPAKLSGPQVVRVEAPEPPDRPRSRFRPRHDAPVTQPLMARNKEGAARLRPPATSDAADKKGSKPRPTKDRTHGRRKEETEEEAKRNKLQKNWRQRDIEERQARLTAAGGEGLRLRPTRRIAAKGAKGDSGGAPSRPKSVVLSEPILVKDLAAALAVKVTDIIGRLMKQGTMATANQSISHEVAELIALEFDIDLVVERKATLEEEIQKEIDQRERANLKRRPIVAAMLGHVDHGKTSLLDRIRKTHVAAGEAGGITQHTGAYQVSWDNKTVAFLDTPGHEAFTAMRARGANMTDIVVLVVAADDGVMPQTIEAIAHSKAAGVAIVVALNKIDLPGIDLNRIYAQLSEHGLTPTEWGGQTEVVKTSATTGLGMDDLLEALDYVADLLELKADDTIPATGWVVEARMSTQEGPVATVLIKEGRLEKGDILLAGKTYGRVRQMTDSAGKKVKFATSSMPVAVAGLNGVPLAGDRFYVVDDINKAKAAAEENTLRAREKSLAERTQVTMENLFSQIAAGNVKELNLIIRADVQGSVDVLKKYLSELSTEEVRLNILQAMPGGITEGDVLLAEASNAIIIGFNVVAEERAQRTAEAEGVDIRLYNIIYRITDDLRKSMAGLLEPEEQEKTLGRAMVRATFKVSRVGTVAGCYVTNGVAAKAAKVRLIRNNIVVRDSVVIESLKHFKDDAREVKAGLECGVKLAGFDDIKMDDVLEFYEIIKVARTLGS